MSHASESASTIQTLPISGNRCADLSQIHPALGMGFSFKMNRENNFHWAIEILVSDRKLKPGEDNKLLPTLESVYCRLNEKGVPIYTYEIKDPARVMNKRLMFELALLLEDEVVCTGRGRIKTI